MAPTTSPCADHCRTSFGARRLSYGADSREAFVRDNPALCGQAYDVTLRGYERWLVRASLHDGLDSFAKYLSARFDRAVIAARRQR
jgi:hypothetical protein